MQSNAESFGPWRTKLCAEHSLSDAIPDPARAVGAAGHLAVDDAWDESSQYLAATGFGCAGFSCERREVTWFGLPCLALNGISSRRSTVAAGLGSHGQNSAEPTGQEAGQRLIEFLNPGASCTEEPVGVVHVAIQNFAPCLWLGTGHSKQ